MVMIDFPLRRTALAAAAALFLGTATQSATAQTDAAFAEALGKTPAGLVKMAQLKTQSQRPAAATQAKGPTAPADAWKRILDKVKRDGVKGADKDFFSQSLTVFSGDREGDYNVHRVTVFYSLAADKNFKVVGVEFTHEQGTLLWTYDLIGTDHWDILADSSGEAGQAIYEQSTYEPGNSRIPGTPAVVDLADPRVKASFDKMLAFWSTR